MVLGLGSRSKKDRASAVSQLVELDLHLHEIKPWQGLAKPPKTPIVLCLRSSRGERLMGSSKNLTPTLGGGAEMGKIVIAETLRIQIAPNREVLKRAKKLYPDLDNPIAFTLLDVNDLKGKPLAEAAFELSSLASLPESKLIAVPFSVSKKVAKGPIPYLHLTVEWHQEDKAVGVPVVASSATSISSRTSDASSVPPLDEDTQQMLVAALLSDEDDKGDNKEEEIESFTDDEEDYKTDIPVSKAPLVPSLPQGNMIVEPVAPTVGNVHQRPSNLAVQQIVEKQQPQKVEESLSRQPQRIEESLSRQPQRIEESIFKQPQRVEESLSRHGITSPQALPVKAAAIAAANAYTKKHSFFTRDTHVYMDDSDDMYSDLDSDEEHEVSSRLSQAVRSPSLPPKGPQTARGRSQLSSWSMRSSESVPSASANRRTSTSNQNASESKAEKIADVNASGKSDVLDNAQTKESKSSTMSAVSTIAEMRVVGGVIEDRAESKDSVNITTTENVSTLSLTNGSSSEPRLVPEKSLRIEAVNGKGPGDVIVSSQKIEIAKSDSSVDPIREAAVKHQAKTSVDVKAKPALRSPLKEKSISGGPPKLTISKSPDPMKGRSSQSPVQDVKTPRGTTQEGKAKAVVAETRIQHLELEVEKLKGELRDVAVVEAALYSTTAEHGSSSMKLHAPARRLARMYLHACKHWSQERRASCARNAMSGLVLVARACGNDVPRLTFWWSNATVLREIISTASNGLPTSPNMGSLTHESSKPGKKSSPNGKKQHQIASSSHDSEDWGESSTFTAALERLESWIFTKVVESIWWQVLTPQMQQPIKEVSSDIDENDFDLRQDYKHSKRTVNPIVNPELEDARQGNISVEIWKKAFLDAFERLCPVRRLGVECGCLPMLNKLVLEACVVRLDVAMFNAILRDDETPMDPVSDPISDLRVLPIPNSFLSFGLGAQLKNAVATLSSFISNLVSQNGQNVWSLDDEKQNVVMFPFLKAMGGLLMLPKDMLIDKSLRKEVCPTLDLPFIGRILSKFQPDEFSPEPVTLELLQTINSEVAAENQKEEMEDSSTTFRLAIAPLVIYSPPPSSMVKEWIGDDASTNNRYGRSNSSVLRKGHTSDDEIDELESPISWLLENTTGFPSTNGSSNIKRGAVNSPKDAGTNRRYMLLREVWNSG